MRVKICCIGSVEEAQIAIAHGATALGLVGHMPSGPGVITDRLIAEIAKAVPPPIATFLLTSETAPERIVAHAKATRTNTIQLVDAVPYADYAPIRQALPGVKLVQVIHVQGEESLEAAAAAARFADALLLDSGNPTAQVKTLGGTGKPHNWAISRKIVEQSTVPVFLAGGLNADNVRTAIEQVRPFGVDLCSGVRTEGRLDPIKLKAFMDAALGTP